MCVPLDVVFPIFARSPRTQRIPIPSWLYADPHAKAFGWLEVCQSVQQPSITGPLGERLWDLLGYLINNYFPREFV